MNRRDLLKNSAKALLLASTVSLHASATEKKTKTIPEKSSQNAGKYPRIVVVGGGWSGLSFAKHIKQYIPNAAVTLVEKRDEFISCPVSNAWLFNMVELDFLTHSYLDASNHFGYTYFQATATGLDAKADILHTTEGDISYDYLIFATGIEYDYHHWSKGDEVFEKRLAREYPAAFIPGSEHITLKNKIKHFKGGNFVLTVPNGNYRCLSAPYERACLLADHFKHHKIKGKVLLLDANNQVTIKEEGYMSAFKELYKGYLEYMPATEIESIDLDKQVITTGFDEIPFEEMSFYPNVRAPKLLEKLGLTTKTPYNRVEANLDVYTNKFKGHHNIFGCGDLRPMGFSKSGNTAYTEGANVARMVSEDYYKKKIEWKTPTTFCESIVSKDPHYEISLVSEYKYGPHGETQFKSSITDEKWRSNGLGKANAQFSWATSMYNAMFYV